GGVDKRGEVERGEQPFVGVEDERVRLFEAFVLRLQRAGEDARAAIRAVDVEPPAAVPGERADTGQVVDDACVRRTRRADHRRDVGGIGGEGGAGGGGGAPAARGVRPPPPPPPPPPP